MKTIVLDDSKEYIIAGELVIDDIKYTLFVNIDDPKNVCYRKSVIEDNEEYYIGLDDYNEFEKVATKFAKEANKFFNED